jgi:hypothetical protein
MLNISLMIGNGYGTFFVATFNFLKSTQILHSPFFGITIINDNHKAFIIYVNLVVNNLSISCLTIATQLRFNMYLT